MGDTAIVWSSGFAWGFNFCSIAGLIVSIIGLLATIYYGSNIKSSIDFWGNKVLWKNLPKEIRELLIVGASSEYGQVCVRDSPKLYYAPIENNEVKQWKPNGPREEAKWDDAFNLLVKRGLICRDERYIESWRFTGKGYRLVEQNKKFE